MVHLYLRLNGYFTSGLIVHSEIKSKLRTELDKIAVRFPNHLQKDRPAFSSKFLQIPNNIDVIISEVKSKGQRLQFNKPLKNSKSDEIWIKTLNWIGLFSDRQIIKLTSDLKNLIQPKKNNTNEKFLSKNVKTNFGIVTIRPILFSPEKKMIKRNQIRFVHQKEILDFIWECLCPLEDPESCSTYYDYRSWGVELAPIVQVFKKFRKNGNKINEINTIYDELVESYCNCYSILLS